MEHVSLLRCDDSTRKEVNRGLSKTSGWGSAGIDGFDGQAEVASVRDKIQTSCEEV